MRAAKAKAAVLCVMASERVFPLNLRFCAYELANLEKTAIAT